MHYWEMNGVSARQCGCPFISLNQSFLESNDVEELNWPAMSTDFDIIENVWRQFVRQVSTNRRQFSSVLDLQDAIMIAWNSIDEKYIRNLYCSNPTRLISIFECRGKTTNYSWFVNKFSVFVQLLFACTMSFLYNLSCVVVAALLNVQFNMWAALTRGGFLFPIFKFQTRPACQYFWPTHAYM